VKSACDSDVFTPPTSNIVSEQEIVLETRKTRSAKASKFFHLSPKSKKNAEKWDLTTAFATKLELEDLKTKTFDLGGAESSANTVKYVEENTCQVAQNAPIVSPQKLAQEIEDFLLKQQVFTDIIAGTTASGGELKVWTPPPGYKSAHIAVTESLTSADTDTEPEIETDTKLETTVQASTDSDTISVNLADVSTTADDTPETIELIATAADNSDTVSINVAATEPASATAAVVPPAVVPQQ